MKIDLSVPHSSYFCLTFLKFLMLCTIQEASKKVHERAAEQVRSLEEELAKSR